MSDKPEAAKTEAAENKPESQNKIGTIILLSLCVLLLLGIVWSMVSGVLDQYQSELDSTYKSLSNSIFAVRNLIDFEDSLQDSYRSFDLREARIFTDVAKVYMDYNDVTEAVLSDYAYRMGNCEIFYFPTTGAEIKSDNADTFQLEQSQLRTLKTAGSLEAEDGSYTAIRLENGWLYFRWASTQELYSVDFKNILETFPNDLCVIDNTTGGVVAISGTDAYDFLDDSRIVYDAQRTTYEADGVKAGTYGGGAMSGGVYFVKLGVLDRYTVFSYTPLRSVLTSALRVIAPVFLLTLMILGYILYCALRLRKQGEDIQDQAQCQQFTKDYYINLPVARHTATLLLVGLALIVAISIHLPLLNSYTKHNAKMENNLDGFVSEMQLSDREWDKFSEVFQEMVINRANLLAEIKDMTGESFTNSTLSELTRSMDFVSTTIYDETGTVVMSTSGYVGYKLSQNPEDDEFALWSLLNNADTTLMREKADGSGYIVAVRRLDAPGLVCATLTDSALRAMREQTNVNAALLRMNTDTYAKAFASAAKPDTLLWAASNSAKLRSLPNSLPDIAMQSRYFGTQTVAGDEYYLNTMNDDEHIVISAERADTLTKPMTGILLRIIPGSVLLAIAILFTSCVYREIDDWLKDDYTNILGRVFSSERGEVKQKDLELDDSLKKMAARLIGMVFATLIALYIFDSLTSESPISGYLFSKQWVHKLNVFSITTILLSVAFAAIGVILMKKLLKILSGRMNTRAETFSNLIASIVQAIVVVVVVIYSLYQLGVDTTVILTSAGVISLIIGYGSQSIVSDLVSGIFLIMEDQIRIGDTLVIDGFRGEVERIGLRSTTLRHYGAVKVINNSKMAGFFNYSRFTAASRWAMSFPVEQDVDQVKDLIMSNAERFQKACKGNIIKGPIWTGVTETFLDYTGHSHFTIQVLFVTTTEEWNSVRKRSFEEAYRIMIENGIKPSSGERKSI